MSELEQAVLTVLVNYSQDVEELLRSKVTQQKIENTRELLQSIATAITTQNNLAEMQLSFNDYGRYIDMLTIDRFQQPPVNQGKYNILQWVESRGVENFARVPGYLNSSPIDKRKAATRIAWAISKSILNYNRGNAGATSGINNNTKRRRRAWYAKTFWSTLPKLTNKLLDALTQEQIRQLQELAG